MLEHHLDKDTENEQLWVTAVMAKPGKHQYIVKTKNGHYKDDQQEHSSGSLINVQHIEDSDDIKSQEIISSAGESSCASHDPIWNYSFHTCVISPRTEEIPKFIKLTEKQMANMRVFKKE